MKAHIAIDIGGTQMRAASYSVDSLDPIKINRIQSRTPGSKPTERLIDLIKSVWPEDHDVSSMATAIAGPLDIPNGRIIRAPNIPDLNDFFITDYLSKKFGVPIAIGNDANLAALGEWRYGAGQGHNHLIYITISTGIGSGIITEGKLLVGSRGMAAELGHTTVVPDGPICSCGKRGHLEAIASGTAIAAWVKEELARGTRSTLLGAEPFNARRIAEAAKGGDPLALAAFERAGTTLGKALTDFVHIFNPSMIIFGGGVSNSINLLLPHIENAMQENIFAPGYLDDLKITTAALGDDAGLLGALALAREFRP
jgi:glucokinase